MDCVIPSHSVRTFGTAITCLSRIGKDVYMEFDETDGWMLRSLNDSKSAYACVRLEPAFFERYAALHKPKHRNKRRRAEEEEDDVLSCRVTVRSLVPVIKPRKNVLSLSVTIPHPPPVAADVTTKNNQRKTDSDTSSSCWTMQFGLSLESSQRTLLGVTHRIPLSEAESLSAVCDDEDATILSVSPRLLAKALDPLSMCREVAMTVGPKQGLLLSSFMEATSTSGTDTRLQTETGLALDDLDLEYPEREISSQVPPDVNESVTLVSSLKEARAFLQFCKDQMDVITMKFHWGGRPLVLEGSSATFRIQLVLATLDHKVLGSHRKQVNNEQ